MKSIITIEKIKNHKLKEEDEGKFEIVIINNDTNLTIKEACTGAPDCGVADWDCIIEY